jgi:hypothetical protein
VRLHWAVEAQYELFPASRSPLFDDWAREAVGNILQSRAGGDVRTPG